MKRAELTPGQEYLTCPTANWDQERSYEHERVVVLDDKPWTDVRFAGRRTVIATTVTGDHTVPERIRPASGGQGVLVSIRDKATGKHHRYDVKPLGQVRGPWAESWARRNANVEAERQRKEAQRAEHAERKAEAERLAALLGGEAHFGYPFHRNGGVILTSQQAQRLVDRLDGLDGK